LIADYFSVRRIGVVVCVDVDAAVHRIAVTKHTGQRIKMMREGKWPEYLRQLQVKQSIAARFNLRSDPAVVRHRVRISHCRG
uniref:Rap1a domain-containing protein n=1 Tax=Anisakis simplex TaxID=6269 RepID=A0A0M3JHJ6_ANISI